jgi:hypothetical protein
MNSFHARGSQAYAFTLRAEFISRTKELQILLRQAVTEQERNRLAEELRELKANFRAQTAHWEYRLF